MTRTFDLGDILTITTERLVSERYMTGVYDILNWMSGEKLLTHQLPRMVRKAKLSLLFQHPQLAEVDPSSIDHDNWQQWLHEQKAKLGATLPVMPLNVSEPEPIRVIIGG